MATAPKEDLFAPPAEPAAAGVDGLTAGAQRELARIMSSPSIGAAVERRVLSFLRHGHTIEDDRDRPLFDLPRKAGQYVAAAQDLLGQDNGGPATGTDQAERRERALVKLATAAALIFAAHDALAWACALEPAAEVRT